MKARIVGKTRESLDQPVKAAVSYGAALGVGLITPSSPFVHDLLPVLHAPPPAGLYLEYST